MDIKTAIANKNAQAIKNAEQDFQYKVEQQMNNVARYIRSIRDYEKDILDCRKTLAEAKQKLAEMQYEAPILVTLDEA
jgi:hypothetical protein